MILRGAVRLCVDPGDGEDLALEAAAAVPVLSASRQVLVKAVAAMAVGAVVGDAVLWPAL